MFSFDISKMYQFWTVLQIGPKLFYLTEIGKTLTNKLISLLFYTPSVKFLKKNID